MRTVFIVQNFSINGIFLLVRKCLSTTIVFVVSLMVSFIFGQALLDQITAMWSSMPAYVGNVICMRFACHVFIQILVNQVQFVSEIFVIKISNWINFCKRFIEKVSLWISNGRWDDQTLDEDYWSDFR